MSEDPIGAGLNWYTYCSNNPVNRIDPWGLEDVMVTYIAQKNGGTVVYFDETDANGVRTRHITVTINGITKVYSIGEKDSIVRIVNDKSVMDSNVLLSDFKLGDRENLVHMAGDQFDSSDHTVMAFGLTYYPRSKSSAAWSNGCEYATVIYENANGSFSFGNVMPAKAADTADFAPFDTTRTIVGWIHTHPNPGAGYAVEEFSGNAGGHGDGAFTN